MQPRPDLGCVVYLTACMKSRPGRLYGGPCILLDLLPPELLQIIIVEHLEDRVDVQAMSCTCHALHSLTSSPALEAAWLWRWHGNQAFFQAFTTMSRSLTVLRLLVEVHHADINAQADVPRSLAFSLLHVACQFGLTDVAEILTSFPGINVNLACGDGGMRMAPLHVACSTATARSGDSPVLALLLQHPAVNVNADSEVGSSLHAAVIVNRPKALRQLLRHPGVEVNALDPLGRTGLVIACLQGSSDLVAELLQHPDVDVNSEVPGTHGLGPLRLAAAKGDTAIVALLLQHPAIQVNAAGTQGTLQGMSPLFLASSEGHAHVVRELLRHPDIQVNANANLGIACANERLTVLRELLQHPGMDAGSIRAAVAEAERRGQTVVVALLRGHRAVRRALRGRGGA